MAPLAIASVAQAGAGLLQGITGFIQNAKANKIARNNKRPDYSIPKPILDNQNLAEALASRGLSDNAIELYRKGSDRQESSAIDAIIQGGGTVNNISDLYSATNDGIAKVALMDEEMRSRNLDNLMRTSANTADFLDKEWEIDVWGPYADKAAAAAALKKQGSDNLSKGINTIGSAAANYAIGQQYAKDGNTVSGETDDRGLSGRSTASVDRIPLRQIAPPYQTRAIPRQQTVAEKMQAMYPGLNYIGFY